MTWLLSTDVTEDVADRGCSLIAPTATLGVRLCVVAMPAICRWSDNCTQALRWVFHLCVSTAKFTLPDTSRSPRPAKGRRWIVDYRKSDSRGEGYQPERAAQSCESPCAAELF